VDKSLQIRKRKMLARMRDREREAKGELRPGEICLAAAQDATLPKSPLIFRRGHRPTGDDEYGLPEVGTPRRGVRLPNISIPFPTGS
jgi:hypothetical protein